MRPNSFLRSSVGIIALTAALVACASRGTPAPAALANAACDTVASGRMPDGRTLLQAYDSLSTLARALPPERLVLTPYTKRPELANTGLVQQLLKREYPRPLRDAGIQGAATVAVLIGADGKPVPAQIVRSSGHVEMDQATLNVVRAMRFRPAVNGSCPVPFFTSIPISWVLAR